MNTLKFQLTPKSFPYEEKYKLPDEIWGNIVLKYGDLTLLDQDWNIAEVIAFFEENRDFLLKEIFPYNNNISIAEERDNLYITESTKFLEADDDDGLIIWHNSLNQYFRKHHFHLQGTDTPIYRIGLKSNGLGEISYQDNGQYVQYFFDMNLFINDTESEIQRIRKELGG